MCGRTITVYENGKVLRKTTYYSHYARVNGIILVGTGGSTTSTSTSTHSGRIVGL